MFFTGFFTGFFTRFFTGFFTRFFARFFARLPQGFVTGRFVVPDSGVPAATLEMFRDTNDDVQDRWVRLFIDDEPAEILRYGETFRRQLTPGRHRVKAHNTLSKDVIEFDAAAGQTIRIRCHNHFAKGGMLMMLTIGFAFITVRLEIVT